ncbi:uncharacterized protein P884DRAFT_122835 [Thermothelomyces heterothallicus CBS 202.75]|uniref:uncharacterized protein n=1 Tax=Thermothelomyces heterothallicus CBS 202.75 TaxID=1149848 RepID=UPI003744B0CD
MEARSTGIIRPGLRSALIIIFALASHLQTYESLLLQPAEPITTTFETPETETRKGKRKKKMSNQQPRDTKSKSGSTSGSSGNGLLAPIKEIRYPTSKRIRDVQGSDTRRGQEFVSAKVARSSDK